MAIAFVQQGHNINASTSVTVTLGANTTTGNSLIACVNTGGGATDVSSISGAGTWTRVTGLGSNSGTELWWCANITSATTTITINFAGGESTGAANVSEFSGLNNGTDGSNTGSGSANPMDINMTTANANDLLVECSGLQGNHTPGVGGSWTLLTTDGNANSTLTAGYQIVSVTNTYHTNMTNGGANNWDAIIAAFQASVAAAGAFPLLGQHLTPGSQPLEATLLQRL